MEKTINELKNKTNERLTELKKKSSLISVLRLISFVGGIPFLIAGISDKKGMYIFAGAYLLITFFFLIYVHACFNKMISHDETYINVLDRYLNRLNGNWMQETDDGGEFLTQEDVLSRDIDLLGKNSLYQYISIAHTPKGRRRLADTLSLKTDNLSVRAERYKAVKELSLADDFRYEFETRTMKNSKLLEAPEVVEEKFPVWMYPLMLIVPLINIISLIMVFGYGYNPGLILATFVAGLAITWIPKGKLDVLSAPVYVYGKTAGDFYEILNEINKSEFQSGILSELKNRVTGQKGILKAVKDMQRMGDFAAISFNPIIHMLLAGFIGWDFYLARRTVAWTAKNKDIFTNCEDIIAEFEELGSLAVLSAVRETTEPEIIEDMKLGFDEIYHPLINREKVVSNSGNLDGHITIITGSNMSGKTTFMRTIAVNAVLAYAGAGVCAKSFKLPIMQLFTSMRITDDVSSGISTFYAEILRIKRAADYVEAGSEPPALCLIDEIFKGTNSADRIVGATEAVKKLSSGKCMVILTTHDFELCDISAADGRPADNYHFEEYYENDEILFDYKMKSGRCTTRNAIALLKMAGIVKN
jgi:hypothetical protein